MQALRGAWLDVCDGEPSVLHHQRASEVSSSAATGQHGDVKPHAFVNLLYSQRAHAHRLTHSAQQAQDSSFIYRLPFMA